MTLIYNDNGKIYNLGRVITNHSISIEEAMRLLDVDMDKFCDDHGWDAYDYDSLLLVDDSLVGGKRVTNTTDYTTMEDKELLGILDDAHSWADVEVEPCFRELCGRHGIDYDKWNFEYYGCDGLFDLLREKVEESA